MNSSNRIDFKGVPVTSLVSERMLTMITTERSALPKTNNKEVGPL